MRIARQRKSAQNSSPSFFALHLGNSSASPCCVNFLTLPKIIPLLTRASKKGAVSNLGRDSASENRPEAGNFPDPLKEARFQR
ncbi:hypothetical protein BV898_06515 [Hypsibius exemplaris]|uniref:Uncharacterized protein n=1 Tax=Hypsibius exemplaris TaxID=2072580 RepID=A0A1W0WWG0_HYPEX|nr:hypothetical protein BV898_06515 [Hypsibius exemplaris]